MIHKLCDIWASRRYLVMLAIACAAGATSTMRAQGGNDCCCHCGCHSTLQKVCRLVCETKKVTETHYGVTCEDICLPSKSHKCGCEWIPSCGRVKTIKKLTKFETTKEVPVYKCVVETICRNCCDRQAALESRQAETQVAEERAGNVRSR